MIGRCVWKRALGTALTAWLILMTAACTTGQSVLPTAGPTATAWSVPTATAAPADTAAPPPAATPPAPSPTPPAPPAASTSRNLRVGVRVTFRATEAQIDFINRHYDYVMTPFLSREIRDRVQGPRLILYRSIQGTWTGFDQFDWAHIDAHENMFCHHQGERILTIWNSWLMDPNDRVDPAAPDALDHWINYYAVTASEQVHQYDYDGLFIDSASHRLSPGAVRGKMPDDYDPQKWRQGRVEALAFIKSYLPDKSVVFNGLHSDAGAEESLGNTDGDMWEVFAFKPATGAYDGPEKWREVIELAERYSRDKTIVIVSKKAGLTGDIQARMFIVASALLVSNENVILSMADLDRDEATTILYYPEYDLDLGAPLGGYTVNEQGLFLRRFEKGLVLVNPNPAETLIFAPDGDYRRVVPVGGGIVPPDGAWEGSLAYESVGDEIEMPPVSGIVLMRDTE